VVPATGAPYEPDPLRERGLTLLLLRLARSFSAKLGARERRPRTRESRSTFAGSIHRPRWAGFTETAIWSVPEGSSPLAQPWPAPAIAKNHDMDGR